MDLRRLEYFLAVAEHGGFSAAARRLHVSQPALSLAVRELERELGTPLFERLGRTVVLTPAGRALVGPAGQTRLDVAAARAAVDAVRGLEAGQLSLGCLPTLAADPVAGLIGRFRGLHPAVRIDLADPDDSADLVRLLRTGRSELAVTSGRDAPEDLVALPLADQDLVVALPPGLRVPGRRTAPVDLGDLAEVAWVTTPPGTSTRQLFDDAFAGAGLSPDVAVVTAQRDALLPLVAAGSGAALVPAGPATAASADALGVTLRRPAPAVTRTVVLLHRPGLFAPAARRFVELATAPPAN